MSTNKEMSTSRNDGKCYLGPVAPFFVLNAIPPVEALHTKQHATNTYASTTGPIPLSCVRVNYHYWKSAAQ